MHVLTGADHLSALATLSVGSRYQAFFLGIRWGLGHSTGLVVVAAILLGLDDEVDATKLEHYCNWIVGVFMIGLGVWGVFKALKHKRERAAADEEEAGRQGLELATAAAASDEEQQGEGGGAGLDEEEGRVQQGQGQQQGRADAAGAGGGGGGRGGKTGNNSSSNGHTSSEDAWSVDGRDEEELVRLPINGAGAAQQQQQEQQEQQSRRGSRAGGEPSGSLAAPAAAPSSSEGAGAHANNKAATPTREPLIFLDEECEAADHAVLRCCRRVCHVDMESPLVQRVVAFVIGVVHGIAGPGGILGVLPAVQLHSWQKASLYLGTFCLASTLIMVRGCLGGWHKGDPITSSCCRPSADSPFALDTHTHTHIHHAIYTHLHTQGIFAALYGELSARVASAKKMEFQMEVFSAALSIIVGVLWIVLIIAGKLTVVFGG